MFQCKCLAFNVGVGGERVIKRILFVTLTQVQIIPTIICDCKVIIFHIYYTCKSWNICDKTGVDTFAAAEDDEDDDVGVVTDNKYGSCNICHHDTWDDTTTDQ